MGILSTSKIIAEKNIRIEELKAENEKLRGMVKEALDLNEKINAQNARLLDRIKKDQDYIDRIMDVLKRIRGEEK